MKQNSAMAPKPVWRLTEKVPPILRASACPISARSFRADASTMARLRAAGITHIDHEGDHHDGHQGDRERGAQRPVAALAELQLDQVAEHHVLAAAQDAWRHIGA